MSTVSIYSGDFGIIISTILFKGPLRIFSDGSDSG